MCPSTSLVIQACTRDHSSWKNVEIYFSHSPRWLSLNSVWRLEHLHKHVLLRLLQLLEKSTHPKKFCHIELASSVAALRSLENSLSWSSTDKLAQLANLYLFASRCARRSCWTVWISARIPRSWIVLEPSRPESTRVDQLYKNIIEQQNATELTEWALGCHPLVSSACEQQKPNNVHSCGISSAAFWRSWSASWQLQTKNSLIEETATSSEISKETSHPCRLHLSQKHTASDKFLWSSNAMLIPPGRPRSHLVLPWQKQDTAKLQACLFRWPWRQTQQPANLLLLPDHVERVPGKGHWNAGRAL